MSIPEFIDLCSDEETEVTDVKPTFLSSISQEKTSNRFANDQQKSGEYFIKHELEETRHSTLLNGVPNDSRITDQACLYANGSHPAFGSPYSSVTPCRQFWKSGDYELGQTLGPVSRNGQNRLRIHPKFLHSNATSHKWAFGAIAELLDNAIDEVQNGATFVILDKFTNPQNGDPTLVIQDDGGGMDPESLRRCMSFGFSDKQSNSSIGQYGNGFKTSTMRLGADVIVFSRCMSKRVLTQSIGILSYTFLRQTGADDVVVPMVDYEFDPLTGAFGRLIRHDKKHFASNLSTILKWSPFPTEAKLLEQFNDIGHHGTKVVVYNLWFNDDGDMELDFESDRKDIVINGARKIVPKNSTEHILTQKNIANRLHFSLRAYSSVLYLRIPENFKIILRGEVVEPHHIVKDLTFRECISYKPQVGGILQAEVLTTIGFVDGAPQVNVHGFNVYHRNRLILPFWRVAHNSYGKGRGVVGVLEANFIKPTHDKQDFEKSAIYQKLETRLKDMTYEYWDFHCHLIGYTGSKHPSVLNPAAACTDQMPQLRTSNGKGQVKMSNGAASITGASQAPRGMPSCISADSRLVTASNAPTYSSPGQSNYDANSKTGLPHRRKHERDHTAEIEILKKQNVAVGNADGLRHKHKALVECDVGHKRTQEVMTMMQQNKKLREQCVEYEETVEKLLLKAEKVRRELREAQQVYRSLLEEHRSLDEVKAEKL